MHERPAIPRQLLLEFGAGERLMNRAARHSSRLSATCDTNPLRPPATSPARRREAHVVTLGAEHAIRQFRRLLQTRPLARVEQGGRCRIRVLGAIDYVIDRSQGQIHTTPSDAAVRNGPFGAELTTDNIELLHPLCRPAALYNLAFLASGVCAQSTPLDDVQRQLWRQNPNALQALPEICARAWNVVRHDPAFRRLRAELSWWLIHAIGPDDIDLALRARDQPHKRMLMARDVQQVWRYRCAYERMRHENPHLLPFVTAWLRYLQPAPERFHDAVPFLRGELLADGLQPKAWRYLVRYGPRRLMSQRRPPADWMSLRIMLDAMGHAGWPEPPPRRFLELLLQHAGVPRSPLEGSRRYVPGWFWRWICEAATACRDDPKRSAQLRKQLPTWAVLVRSYQPRPDANQRRRGLRWLARWATRQQALERLGARDAWAPWLRGRDWCDSTVLQVVPLLFPRAVAEEAWAMHNCADDFIDACARGEYLLLSLRRPDSSQRLALMGLARRDGCWQLDQLAGPCNDPVPAPVKAAAERIAAAVRRYAARAQQAAHGTQPAVRCPD